MDETVIRRGALADVDAIVEHQTICWREAYTGVVPSAYLDDPAGVDRRTRRWREVLSGGAPVDVWVAVRGGRIVGVARSGPARDGDSPVALELMSIYVRRDEQRDGVGSRLLGAAIGTSAAIVWLFAANASARAFYERHGFAADGIGKIDEDTGIAEIRMIRTSRD